MYTISSNGFKFNGGGPPPVFFLVSSPLCLSFSRLALNVYPLLFNIFQVSLCKVACIYTEK